MKPTPVIALAAALILASAAAADFLGIYVDRLDCSECLKTYRIYALFSEPTDQLLAVSGTAEHPLSFDASAPLWNDGGAFAGFRQEDFAAAPVSGPRDSWVTIGADQAAGNDTSYSPGFLGNDGVHAVIVGSSFSDDDDGWFDSNPGLAVIGTEILIAQLSFAEGLQFFELSGNVAWEPEVGAFEVEPFHVFYGEGKFVCPWDLDLSDSVDFPDLLAVLAAWGPCPAECCPADFDDDGGVGIEDLLVLLANWGPCF